MEKINDKPYELIYREFIKLHTSPNVHLIKRFDGNNTQLFFYLSEYLSSYKGEDLFKVTVGISRPDNQKIEPVELGQVGLLSFIQEEATQMVREYFSKLEDMHVLKKEELFYLQLFIEIEEENKKTLVSTYAYKNGRWRPIFIPI